MLIGLTNTNSAPSEAAILPGVADHLRAQVARELVRVRMTRTETSDIGRGYGCLSVKHIRVPRAQSARSLRPAPFEREKLAICSLVAAGLTSVVSI